MTAEPREPWSKFFWADWRSDPRLRLCSLGARGLWLELLGLMHEAAPRGHLLVNGQAPSDPQLAGMVGATAAELRRLKAELLAAGVPSVEDGVWISRRMVRDTRRQAVNRANGRAGGNPRLRDNRPPGGGTSGAPADPDNRAANPPDKPYATPGPEARSQRPEPGGGGGRRPTAEQVRQVFDAIGWDWNDPAHAGSGLRLATWLDQGLEFDLDVLPTLIRVMAGKRDGPPRTLSYFDRAVADARARRLRPLPEGTRHAAAAVPPARPGRPPVASRDDIRRGALDALAGELGAVG